MIPAVADRTLALYGRLPEAYRDADAGLDYPLLRYLSLLADQLDPIDVIADRIDYDADEGGTSDLVDADTANAGWLPWLAQLLGVRLAGLTLAQQRTALADPVASWAHGTPAAIIAAAKVGLTGTQSVVVTPHYGGSTYVIGLGTKDGETGVATSWGQLKAAAPSWAGLEARGSFTKTATNVILAAEVERPAGYRFVRYSTGA